MTDLLTRYHETRLSERQIARRAGLPLAALDPLRMAMTVDELRIDPDIEERLDRVLSKSDARSDNPRGVMERTEKRLIKLLGLLADGHHSVTVLMQRSRLSRSVVRRCLEIMELRGHAARGERSGLGGVDTWRITRAGRAVLSGGEQ